MLQVLTVVLVIGVNRAAMDVSDISAAFESTEGLWLRVSNLIEARKGKSAQASASLWRKDVPLAIYRPVRSQIQDQAGIIFAPGRARAACAYPVNANSWVRTKPGSSENDPCGVMEGKWGHYANISGKCTFTSAEDYAEAYYAEPIKLNAMWDLESSTCHFTRVQEMFNAQKALLHRCMQTPPNLDEETWLNYAGMVGVGLTAFNEAVVEPFSSADVGGVFWAHSGPFRTPSPGDRKICDIAKYSINPINFHKKPIFELANVNMGRPFDGCKHDAGDTSPPDCLKKGLKQWQDMTNGGGYNASLIFRPLSRQVLLKTLASTICLHLGLQETALNELASLTPLEMELERDRHPFETKIVV